MWQLAKTQRAAQLFTVVDDFTQAMQSLQIYFPSVWKLIHVNACMAQAHTICFRTWYYYFNKIIYISSCINYLEKYATLFKTNKQT